MRSVLLLAGTAEARDLAAHLGRLPGIAPVASLAGVTAQPAAYPIPVRRGGFGGIEGLAAWLAENRTVALVDATHPFATQMQDHAARAAWTAGIAHLRLLRPPWPDRPGWIAAPDIATAASLLPAGAKVLVTAGRKDLAPFRARTDLDLLLRTIEPVPNLPEHVRSLLARPVQNPDAERDLLLRERITHLVAKNSGGPATARLDAADALRLTTIMVVRPQHPAGEVVETVDAAVAWISSVVATGP